MPTNLYFVRHAHSTYTPDEKERPLSSRGFSSANTVTELLQGEAIDVVYSSPYRRAIQTVEGIAEHIDEEIEIVDGFKERVLAEKPVEDFTAAITKVWQDENFSWRGGESNRTAKERGVRSTLQVLKRNEGKNIVIGTHGNIMVLIMNHFDNQYGFDFWTALDMPDIYRLSFVGEGLMDVQRVWGRPAITDSS